MFKDEFNAAAAASQTKYKLLKNDFGAYLMLSMMAGIFVGFGILLVFTISGQLEGAGYSKVIMGATFSVALALVVMAGGELFTGNNFVMTAGLLNKNVTLKETSYLWLVCWVGNLLGAILLAVIYSLTGLCSGATLDAMTAATVTKVTLSPAMLLSRGILCNVLVCLAVWCGFKMKSESGKLIMIFLCILTFFTTGFEHSVANMTLLSLALINSFDDAAITFGSCLYNLIIVTIGNMIGGAFLVAFPYYIASGNRK